MGTVLWANVLVDGEVVSAEEDLYVLFNNQDVMDSIAKELDLPAFTGICDSTDYDYNMDEDAGFDDDDGYDDDYESDGKDSNQEMAANGLWMPMTQALGYLEALREHIASAELELESGDDASDLLEELDHTISFAKSYEQSADKFNFSIVM